MKRQPVARDDGGTKKPAAEDVPRPARSNVFESTDARRAGVSCSHHAPQVTLRAFVKLNVDAVQNAAALRYHAW